MIVDAVSLAAGQDPTFSTSPVEAVLVVLVEHRYSSNIGYFMRTIPKFIRLILTLTGFICIYTALGFMIFSPNSQEARKYFGFYGSSVWNMLMVLNGSNWPDPMMPAFDENRAYFVYFFVYIMIAGWGLLNLLQGFIYVFFKEELLIIQERKTFIRHQHLMQAFRLLDSNKVDYLTYAQIDRLLQVMYASFIFSQTLIPPTPEERYELILELDVQKNNVITISDFLLIDEKCFNYALKVLRSKRARFTRFLRAKHGRQSMDSQRDSFVLSNALLEVSASNNKNLAENKPKSIVRKGFIDYFDGWFRDRRSGDEIITLTQDCEDPTYATPSNQNDFQVSRNSTATEGVFERSVSEAAQKYGKVIHLSCCLYSLFHCFS